MSRFLFLVLILYGNPILLVVQNSDELIASVYTFLVAQGHKDTAKAFAKESKKDEKVLKSASAPQLLEVFTSYKATK
jgi:hypothetical protein